MTANTYGMWLQERSEKDIIRIPEGFLQGITDHIARLRAGYNLLEKSSLRYRLITRELELLEYMLQDLMAIRRRKILGVKPHQRIEEDFQSTDDWDVVQKLLEAIDLQEQTLRRIVHGEMRAKRPPIGKAFTVVRVLKGTPTFVGVDGDERGPYAVEDVVSLPTPNARMLVRQGYAEAIVVSGRSEDSVG